MGNLAKIQHHDLSGHFLDSWYLDLLWLVNKLEQQTDFNGAFLKKNWEQNKKKTILNK